MTGASAYSIAEQVLGAVSIGCWVIVFTPQLWKNYLLKSGESLSVLFLVIWLVGDVFSVAGLFLLELQVYQIVLAVYYAVVDAFLIWQVYYYRSRRHRESLLFIVDADDADDRFSIVDEEYNDGDYFGDESTDTKVDYSGNRDSGSYRDNQRNQKTLSRQPNEQQPLLHGTSARPVLGLQTSKMALPLLIVSCMLRQYQAASLSALSAAGDSVSPPASSFADAFTDLSTAHLVGYICAYLSAVLYVGSRIPQLLKNWQVKSCEGLSIWLFLFSVLGNGTYVMALAAGLMDNFDMATLAKDIPYLIGSGGTLIFDFAIFLQFFAYRRVGGGAHCSLNNTPATESAEQKRHRYKKLHDNIIDLP